MPTVVIAGTGLAGLACAAHLSAEIDCILVERLPVAGGEDWEERHVRELVRRARERGARISAGTQAVRWDGSHVLLLGAESHMARAHALVVATGHRPLTLGELGVAGERCGGVVPATVAQHLIDHGVRLGHRPVIVGGGRGAAAIMRRLALQGAQVHAVLPDDLERNRELPAQHQYPGARLLEIRGRPRVASVQIGWPDGRSQEVACDALILAHGRVPYRNIDGAVLPTPGVVFAQSGQEDAGVEACGAAAAEHAMTLIARPMTSVAVPPRTGVPA